MGNFIYFAKIVQPEYNAKKKAFFLSIVEAPPIFANE